MESEKVKKGSEFQQMPFESPGNGMRGTFGYDTIKANLAKIHENILAEPDMWIKKSKIWREKEVTSAANLQNQYLQIRHRASEAGMDVSLQDDNPYVWNVLL